MSETNWTPGPWEHEATRDAERIYAVDPGPMNDFTIAFVCDADKATRKAHAYLLSSAPELYAALNSALQDAIARSTEMPSELFEQIIYALAKARGEA